MIMSKKTYATEKTAARAGQKEKGSRYIGTHKLPSGRFCYTFSDLVNND